MARKSILLLIMPVLLFASTKIDSLKLSLNNVSGREKTKIYHKISDFYYTIGNMDSAQHYLIQAYNISCQLKDTISIGNYFFALGSIEVHRCNYYLAEKYYQTARGYYSLLNDSIKIADYLLAQSINYFNQSRFNIAIDSLNYALSIFKKYQNDSDIKKCLNLLAACYTSQGQYVKALKYSLAASSIIIKQHNRTGDLDVNLNLGNIFLSLGYYDKSLRHLQIANQISLEISDAFNQSVVTDNISRVFLKLCEFDSAKEYAYKSLKISEDHNLKLINVVTLSHLGEIYLGEKNINEAYESSIRALKLIEQSDHAWMKSKIYNILGKIFLFQKNYFKAIKSIQNSLDLAIEIGARDLILENYIDLSQYFKETDNYKQALEYHQMYSQLKDSLFILNQSDIADLQISFYTEKQRQENELLQKNNALIKLEAEKQKLLKWIVIMALIILAFLLMIVFYLYHNKKCLSSVLESRIENALQVQRDQQKIIVHQAGLTSLGELAASIAHEINQPLQNIGLCSETIGMLNRDQKIKNKQIEENIQEIIGCVDRVRFFIEHIRMFTSGQRDNFSQEFSINESIQNAYQMLHKQFSVNGIEMDMDLEPAIPPVVGNPYKYEQVVLSLLSNAKDAVFSRSRANGNDYIKKICLRSYYKELKTFLMVRDNGIGIEPENQSKIFEPFFSTKKIGEGQGLGLSISLEIVKEMRGEISIKSNPMQGTTVTVMIPSLNDNFKSESLMPKQNQEIILPDDCQPT